MQFNPLIPELSVRSLERSLKFYTEVLGFRVEYDRPQDRFAFLSIGRAQLMLEQVNGNWQTGELEVPFGRGINFQIEVVDVAPLLERLKNGGCPLFRESREQWYRVGHLMEGQVEFLVQDPDGYLLRFCQYLGSKS